MPKSGALKSGFLAEDATLEVRQREVVFAKDNYIAFFPNGNFRSTAGTVTNTVFDVQGKTVTLRSEYDVYILLGFYDDGTLRQGIFAEPFAATSNGVEINLVGGHTTFYPGGLLRYGTLAQNTELPVGSGRAVFAAETHVILHENGSVAEGTFAEDVELGQNGEKTTYTAGSFVRFDVEGIRITF